MLFDDHDRCEDCYALFSLHMQATVDHISLLQRQGLAAANGDLSRCAELEPQLNAAHDKRKAIWYAIVEHERSVHGREPIAA